MEKTKKKQNYFVKHWFAAVTIAIVTCLVGFIGISSMPIEQYPDIAPPTVNISAVYPGADANTLMKSVIMPIEEAVNGVDDMIYMTSTANANGSADISVFFKQGTDADKANVNVQNRVNQCLGLLPPEVTKTGVTVMKNVNSILQITSLVSRDGKFDEKFINNYLDINVLPRIKRINGVGKTMCLGNQYGVRVWLKPDVMASLGITPEEVSAAIAEQNSVTAIGGFESVSNKFDVQYNGLLNDMTEFQNIIVRSSGGNIVRLGDVADVELGTKTYDFRSSVEGNPGVCFIINQAPGANATQVNAAISETLADIQKTMPAGLEFEVLETSDDFLHASMHNVIETLVIAIILVVLVVYFFLQNVKATIIPSISILVSLIGTFAMCKLAGFTLNLLTLFALVLAIGTVVDDAIVVVEAVMAKFESGYTNARKATSDALSEVSTAVVSCTLVFMAVFIPVTFMPGTSGTFFTQFGFTMAASVGLSMVSALTLCPALCALMLRPEGEGSGKKNVGYWVRKAYTVSFNALLGKYMKGVTKFIKRPALAWILLVLLGGAAFYMMAHSKKDLVPQEDQGFLIVDIATAPGTSMDITEKTAGKLEEHIKTIADVEGYSTITGYSMMSSSVNTNGSTILIRLKNWEEREFYSIASVQDDITTWAALNMPEADVNAFQMPQIPGYGSGSLMGLNIEDQSGSGDKAEFVRLTQEFVKKLAERPETMTAITAYSEDYPKYKLDIDVAQCKRAGVSSKEVLNTIGTYLAGNYISSYIQYGKVYQVQIQAGKQYRMNPDMLNSISVDAGGTMVPVSQFVRLTPTTGAAAENHFNMFPSILVNTMPAQGYSNDDVRHAVDEVMAEVFPAGYGYEYSGMAREEAESAGSNMTLIIYCICILLIYLILGCLYNSIWIPFAVLLSVPFGLLGSFLFVKPLESMGVGNSVYVQTGVIMLIGLLAKTAILITEFAVQKRHEGLSIFDAAVEACRDRLRPIIMTVASMIIGMIPLIIEGGAGAVGNKSLALTVVGGMTFGAIAMLFVVPAFFIFFQSVHEKIHGLEQPDEDAQQE